MRIPLQHEFTTSLQSAVIVLVLMHPPLLQVAGVHGDISQTQRSRAVEQFKSGEVPLLVATGGQNSLLSLQCLVNA